MMLFRILGNNVLNGLIVGEQFRGLQRKVVNSLPSLQRAEKLYVVYLHAYSKYL